MSEAIILRKIISRVLSIFNHLGAGPNNNVLNMCIVLQINNVKNQYTNIHLNNNGVQLPQRNINYKS